MTPVAFESSSFSNGANCGKSEIKSRPSTVQSRLGMGFRCSFEARWKTHGPSKIVASSISQPYTFIADLLKFGKLTHYEFTELASHD